MFVLREKVPISHLRGDKLDFLDPFELLELLELLEDFGESDRPSIVRNARLKTVGGVPGMICSTVKRITLRSLAESRRDLHRVSIILTNSPRSGRSVSITSNIQRVAISVLLLQ
jgi:hypothetical protein